MIPSQLEDTKTAQHTMNSCRVYQGLAAFAITVLFGLLSLGGAGCQSTSAPGANSLASVTITNRTLEEIAASTQVVFTRNGFQGTRSGALQFTFQQPASRMDNLAYGSFVNPNLTVRALVNFEKLGEGLTMVVCSARLVADAGNAVFEDDYRVRRLGSGRYQKILDEIKAQLN